MNHLTSGDIARKTNADRDAVSYAVRKLGIEPVGYAGNVRLFPEQAIEKVKQFIETRTQRKESKL